MNIPSSKITSQGCGQHIHFIQTGNVLINIRGTNGSGKTYTARRIADQFPLVEQFSMGQIKIYDHGDFYLVGSYENECGGLDTVRDFYTVAPTVLELLKKKSVLMEGLLWSSVYSSMHKLEAQCRLEGHSVVWCGFDYPVSLMIERVLSRRVGKGNIQPLKVSNLIAKVKPVVSGLNHAIYFGSNVLVGDSDFIFENAVKILKNNSIEGIQFLDEFYSISDHDLWVERLSENSGYEVFPNEEEVKNSQTSTCLFDM